MTIKLGSLDQDLYKVCWSFISRICALMGGYTRPAMYDHVYWVQTRNEAKSNKMCSLLMDSLQNEDGRMARDFRTESLPKTEDGLLGGFKIFWKDRFQEVRLPANISWHDVIYLLEEDVKPSQ